MPSSSTSSGHAAVYLASPIIPALLAEAAEAHPHECCGILLGTGDTITQIRPAPNVHPSPRTHFEIDPQALIDSHRTERAGGLQVIGYYHSHPVGPPHPSATDRAQAPGDGRVWAIIAAGAVRFWQDRPEGFQTLSYAVASG